MLYLLDLLGTLAFAVGGAYKAKGRQLNIVGVIFLGSITAIGGGTIRDLIIGRTPLFYLTDKNYLIICVVAGIFTYFLPNFFKKTYSIFRLSDSIGLSAFVIIGASVCHGHLFGGADTPTLISSLACIFMGMITGFGGGIIRDSIMGDTPYSLKQGSNYAKSAFCGSAIYFFFSFISWQFAVFFAFFITLFLREIVSDFGIYKKYYLKNKKQL
jgi:uncharacterized membrane protein YeiH